MSNLPLANFSTSQNLLAASQNHCHQDTELADYLQQIVMTKQFFISHCRIHLAKYIYSMKILVDSPKIHLIKIKILWLAYKKCVSFEVN